MMIITKRFYKELNINIVYNNQRYFIKILKCLICNIQLKEKNISTLGKYQLQGSLTCIVLNRTMPGNWESFDDRLENQVQKSFFNIQCPYQLILGRSEQQMRELILITKKTHLASLLKFRDSNQLRQYNIPQKHLKTYCYEMMAEDIEVEQSARRDANAGINGI